MFCWKVNIKEEIEYPFRCHSADVTNGYAISLVLLGKIPLGPWDVQWKPAFPAQQLAVVYFAFCIFSREVSGQGGPWRSQVCATRLKKKGKGECTSSAFVYLHYFHEVANPIGRGLDL
jgi:hypothetical protein